MMEGFFCVSNLWAFGKIYYGRKGGVVGRERRRERPALGEREKKKIVLPGGKKEKTVTFFRMYCLRKAGGPVGGEKE